MKSLETFIIERSSRYVYSYNSPDNIHLDNDYWGESLNWGSIYARAFIYSTKLNDFLFSSKGNNHISIMYSDDDTLKDFDNLYDIAYNQNGIYDLRFISDNDTYNDYKEWKKLNPYFKRFKLGRIWSYEGILYIAWWDELTPTQFIKYNHDLINYINTHESELKLDKFDKIYYMSNSGKLIEYDPNKKVVSTRSTKNRKEIIKAQQAIHLATQKEKQKFFKEFIKNRDENNQKKHYNHTKSKTEAEWRSIRYQGDSLIDTEKNRIIE